MGRSWGVKPRPSAKGSPVQAQTSSTKRATLGRRRKPRVSTRTIAATAVVALLASGLTWAVVQSPGNTVEHVEPNDGTVWVTNDRAGLFGRLNTPAASLDTAFAPLDGQAQTYQLDVLQSGGTVLARDRIASRLVPVDTQTGEMLKDRAVVLPANAITAVGGRSTVVVDPENGTVRAAGSNKPTVASVEGLAPSTKPLGKVSLSSDLAQGAASAAATVAGDGTAYVIGSGGSWLHLQPQGNGSFSVTSHDLGVKLRSVQATTTPDGPLIIDTVALTAILPSGTKVTLPTSVKDGVLQTQSATGAALLATPAALLSLDLGSGDVQSVSSVGTGTPAAPVVVGGCRYAAWAGNPGRAVRACGDGEPAAVQLEGGSSLLTPSLRINRRSAVLNDGASGAVWDLDTGKRLDNWQAVAPEATTDKPTDPDQQPTLTQSQKPPTAVDDDLYARPGLTSVLHPLDNDSNPSGNVLSIRSVGAAQPADSTVSIAPDGQTIQVLMAPGTSVLSFPYTIDDGKGHTSSAVVKVTARDPSENAPPVLRQGFVATLRTVPNQGTLELPVIGDWRDPDSDPVLLESAKDDATPMTVTSDGRIRYEAPTAPGPRTLAYKVTDGRAASEGKVPIEVLSKTSTATTPPTTQPDVGRGEVGKPVVVRPLENDLPGTDPSTPSARLELAGEALAPEGATVETNVKAGTVTVTAKAPGTYLLSYTARYGDAPYGRGTIRVDVVAPEEAAAAPTALLDQAIIHGQMATIVDVLANDFDPSGRLLAVNRAVAESSDALEVAIIRGRWLRIRALRPELVPNPMRIKYDITNGAGGEATGEVAVQQLPPPLERTPLTVVDHATVRSGDHAAIPVLDNDTDPAGEALTVLTKVEGADRVGMLPVRGNGTTPEANGAAYVTGSIMRFQAPEVTAVTNVSVDYVVQNASGIRASGTAYITVLPPPGTDRPNQAPSPPTLEGRVVAGATTTIQIPSSLVDPDGDSVAFVGLGSAPDKGRVMDQTPSSLTYQAYPVSGGTDEFSYVVTDRFGKQGTGTIRIAVVPPGDPQPVVAIDDALTVAPGRTVTIDPVVNDIVPVGDTAAIQPLAPVNPDLGDAALLDPKTNVVRIKAPPVTAPLSVRYAIVGASGEPSAGQILVRSQEGVNLPPVARNAVAQPEIGATTVQVDVLAGAYDPDDEKAALTVSKVYGGQGVKIEGGKVLFKVLDLPQVLAFEVRDAEGAAGVASIYVPSGSGGSPSIKANSLITMGQDSTTQVALKDVVVVPSGKSPILTTTDRLFASPAGMLKVEASGKDALMLTSMKGYNGPAAVTIEVTDGTGVTDPNGKRALLTIPVQIGPETPVLRCPPADLDVVLGGESRPLDVAALCHVWTARPGQLAKLQFTGTLVDAGPGLTVTNRDNHTLAVAASNAAIPGSRARLQIGVAGANIVPAFVNVRVAAADPPTLSPVTVAGVKAGTTKSINVAGHVTSQLGSPQIALVSIDPVSGAAASISRDGPTTISVTPDKAAKGTIVYQVTITDVGDLTRRERFGVGTLTVDVLGVPDAPGRPVQSGPTLSHQVLLAWGVPADNGLPIDHYRVTWGGGEQRCDASPCLISGLNNGTGLTFTVVAVNGVGEGPASPPSEPIKPDAVPEAPRAPTAVVSGPGELRVDWEAAPVDGSPVEKYLVTWPGGSQEVASLTTTIGGLDNSTATPFSIKAMNAAGWGPKVEVSGHSAGPPTAPTGVVLEPTDDISGAQQTVRVSWPAVSPNGPAPTLYTVTRSGTNGTSVTLCAKVADTSCVASPVDNDGTVYTYTVVAANEFFSSPSSQPRSQPAIGRPGPFGNTSASATGESRQVRLTFRSPAAHDATLTISCMVSGVSCGQWNAPPNPTNFDQLITVPANGDTPTIVLTATNSGNLSSTESVTSDTVYGPVQGTALTAVSARGPYVNFTASTDPQGLPATVRVRVSEGGQTVYDSGQIDTTGAPWSQNFSRKLGYKATYQISVEVRRNGPQGSAQDAVSTLPGSVQVASTPIGTTTNSTITITATNLPPSTTIQCLITRANGSWAVSFPTNANGNATYPVPEATFKATSGFNYALSCDDTASPGIPVTMNWTAP